MAYPTIDYFLCSYEELLSRLDAIDPLAYASTRNYLDGSVTWLSPFITHGIIDTTLVAKRILARCSASDCEQLLFELAWREYFHRTWQQHGNAIFQDMRAPVERCENEPVKSLIPDAITSARTGIDAVDSALVHLQQHGLMHNHARLWTAGLVCNIGRTHWLEPAKWMHYQLLDGDLASNTLSWQWVAGSFSNKRYIANQTNINKYSRRNQTGTLVDMSYEELTALAVPADFDQRTQFHYDVNVPACGLRASAGLANSNVSEQYSAVRTSGDTLFAGEVARAIDDSARTIALRSLWHLNPLWQSDAEQQLIFVDLDHYRQWPMNTNRWRFIVHWMREIPNSVLASGSVSSLQSACVGKTVHYREYPACAGWREPTEQRSWLYREPKKPYRSFFAFWKQVKSDIGL